MKFLRLVARSERAVVLLWIVLLAVAAALPHAARAAEKPKVRAVTAFIKIDREHYQEQVTAAVKTLTIVREALEKAGFTVEGIRISTQPFPDYVAGLPHDQALSFLCELADFAGKEHVALNIGPAISTDADLPDRAQLLGEALASTQADASIIVAGEDAVHWNAVHAAARVMKYLEAHTPNGQGNFNFAATAEVPDYTPFFPGAHHSGPGRVFSVALESANVVADAFAGAPPLATARQRLAQAFQSNLEAIQQVSERAAEQASWTYAGIDLSPAPMKDVSIGTAIENLLGRPLGSSGTLTAAALITSTLRSLSVKQAGYSGLMLPILEDTRLAQRWSEERISMDSLLAYSAVCGTGLDTIPLPGDVSEEEMVRIIGDMASLAVKWHKPLSARLLPVPGKKAGERSEFHSSAMVNATVHPLP
jgi:hypothetical protein